MKITDFNKAIEILTNYHSNTIIINYVKPNGFVSANAVNPTIHIINAPCAGAAKELHNNGYSLFMVDGKLSIEKF